MAPICKEADAFFPFLGNIDYMVDVGLKKV
jgi:AICAR transformylase/IMP cyclohydrolase PurH